MNRRVTIYIAIGIIGFLLFFNPFSGRRNRQVRMPHASPKSVEALATELNAGADSPEKYLAGLFDRHSIVFVGEFGLIEQQVDVIARSIPVLYSEGVRHLGFEFALFEDTDRIDQIVTDEAFDEVAAAEVLFDRLVIWGFEEYLEVLRSAWSHNQTLAEGEPPFRIVGLSPRIAWRELESERDVEDPEVMSRVYAGGIPDAVMAETILREFVQKDEPALVYVSVQHAFTRHTITDYEEKAIEIGFDETRRVASIVYDAIGDEAATVLFHSPWPYSRAQTLTTYPVHGMIDRVIKRLPPELAYSGFDVVAAFGELDAGMNDFATGRKELVLADLCDGYIITGPITEYKTVSIIDNFFNETNIAEAARNFPGPNVEETTVEEMNSFVSSVVKSRNDLIERFR